MVTSQKLIEECSLDPKTVVWCLFLLPNGDISSVKAKMEDIPELEHSKSTVFVKKIESNIFYYYKSLLCNPVENIDEFYGLVNAVESFFGKLENTEKKSMNKANFYCLTHFKSTLLSEFFYTNEDYNILPRRHVDFYTRDGEKTTLLNPHCFSFDVDECYVCEVELRDKTITNVVYNTTKGEFYNRPSWAPKLSNC